jgi:plasmid replication initiation protein
MKSAKAIRTQNHKSDNYVVSSPERPAGERWINMSNALARAGHGLTLAEKRLIAVCISKLDSKAVHRVGSDVVARVTAAEYAEVAQCGMNAAYEALATAADNLYERSITFYEPAHKRNGKSIEMTKNEVRWVDKKSEYRVREGWVSLSFTKYLVPHLLGLKNQITSYQLSQASALRSIYSWKLLELLMRFKSTGWAEYTIEDFLLAMDATVKQSQNFNNIKRRMIEPAIKELEEKDGWEIRWEAKRAGRKVRAVRFEFKRSPQGRLPLE